MSGLCREFLRYGHEANNSECKCCQSECPRLCECGGLIHAHAYRNGPDGDEMVYCCDHCGPDYREDWEYGDEETSAVEQANVQFSS